MRHVTISVNQDNTHTLFMNVHSMKIGYARVPRGIRWVILSHDLDSYFRQAGRWLFLRRQGR